MKCILKENTNNVNPEYVCKSKKAYQCYLLKGIRMSRKEIDGSKKSDYLLRMPLQSLKICKLTKKPKQISEIRSFKHYVTQNYMLYLQITAN